MQKKNKLDITVIILTYNEENNIENCLRSIIDFVKNIIIVDSFSTDSTLEIARKFTSNIYQNEFINYSQQRNWSLDNLPIKSEWILNLDADHRVTEDLQIELKKLFLNDIPKDINGYLISRKTIFMGKWIKYGGHYPAYHSILFRKGFGRCEHRLYDQHFVVKGKSEVIKGDIIDIVTDSITNFTDRHNKWSTFEVKELLKKKEINNNTVKASMVGNQIQKKRYYRNIYNTFPLFIRSFLYYLYRYFIKLGFLDGKEGLIFHFLQGFWFRFLIDAKLYEQKKHNK